MLLNERQKNILELFSEKDNYISTKELSKKFLCSIRTIRYDIENIQYFLKSFNIFVQKVPKKGVRIQNSEKIKEILNNKEVYTRVIISKKKREIMIINYIIANKRKYITSDELSKFLFVSKSTIIYSIKNINNDIQKYKIFIEGKSNYGYMINGEEKKIRWYINNVLINDILRELSDGEIFFELNINDNVLCNIEKILNISMVDEDRRLLRLKISFFVIRNMQEKFTQEDYEKESIYKSLSIYKQIEKLYRELMHIYNVQYIQAEMIEFIAIILEMKSFMCIINNENIKNINEGIEKDIVDSIIKFIYGKFFIRKIEIDILREDLLLHIKATLKRERLGIRNNNPILNDIKMKYGYIFSIIEDMTKELNKMYPIYLCDDDVGFLCIYILKALENCKKRTYKKIALVCNTGRGVAKLLSTRIKNNIPEIDEIILLSVYDIHKEDLDNIELIISTVPIKNIQKNTIIVSSIITSYELSSIREYLYLDNNLKSVQKDDITANIENILIGYCDKDYMVQVSRKIADMLNNNINKDDICIYEDIAMTLVEIMHMLEKISMYKKNYINMDNRKIFGIFIHIVMSIPRWKRRDFVKEENIDEYKKKYGTIYDIIGNTLYILENIHKIIINEMEIVPILMYLI